MRELLIGRAHLRELRDAKFSEPGEVEALVKAAGFNVLSCVSTSTALAKPADALLAQFSKRRFTLIAEPSPMTVECHLVLVHTPGFQASGISRISRGRMRDLAPDIEVFIAYNDIPSSVTRRRAGRRADAGCLAGRTARLPAGARQGLRGQSNSESSSNSPASRLPGIPFRRLSKSRPASICRRRCSARTSSSSPDIRPLHRATT